MDFEKKERLYNAVVWRDDSTPGIRVNVYALSLQEAKSKLEEKYGKECVFSLHNEEDAAQPR